MRACFATSTAAAMSFSSDAKENPYWYDEPPKPSPWATSMMGTPDGVQPRHDRPHVIRRELMADGMTAIPQRHVRQQHLPRIFHIVHLTLAVPSNPRLTAQPVPA